MTGTLPTTARSNLTIFRRDCPSPKVYLGAAARLNELMAIPLLERAVYRAWSKTSNHGTHRAAPARLHSSHLTRALRRPRLSEPGGPGRRSRSDFSREIGRRGRPLGAGLHRQAGTGRSAVRGLLRPGTYCYTAYSCVCSDM